MHSQSSIEMFSVHYSIQGPACTNARLEYDFGQTTTIHHFPNVPNNEQSVWKTPILTITLPNCAEFCQTNAYAFLELQDQT